MAMIIFLGEIAKPLLFDGIVALPDIPMQLQNCRKSFCMKDVIFWQYV
jgi:hypothetical protein